MTPRTLALASLLALAASASAQTPPQELHLVGDHWTAWSPPTSFPEGSQVYTIVPGDTLWGLAGRNLGGSISVAADLGAQPLHPRRALDLPGRPAPARPPGRRPHDADRRRDHRARVHRAARRHCRPGAWRARGHGLEGSGRHQRRQLSVRPARQRRRHLLQRIHRRGARGVPLSSGRQRVRVPQSVVRAPQRSAFRPGPFRRRRHRQVRPLPRRHRLPRSGRLERPAGGRPALRGRSRSTSSTIPTAASR